MRRFWTHYWSGRTCRSFVEDDQEGRLLDHTAGEVFARRKVAPGDVIYIVTNKKGEMRLIGKMVVAEILHSDEEASIRVGYRVWHASIHIIADKRHLTWQHFDRKVPRSVVKRLRFVTHDSPIPLVFDPMGRLDPQTLRNLRQLTPESAALLDGLLVRREEADHPRTRIARKPDTLGDSSRSRQREHVPPH